MIIKKLEHRKDLIAVTTVKELQKKLTWEFPHISKDAAACQQYRICGSGKCPMGMATQDPELRARLHIDAAAQRVANYLNVSLSELKSYARITGHKNLHDLNLSDLCTINREISEFTDIPHV